MISFLFVLFGTALYIPTIFLGLLSDDFFLRGHLEIDKITTFNVLNAINSAFSFITEANRLEGMRVGILPWWSDPQVTVNIYRPLAALTQFLDYQLWPSNFLYMHIHSLVWYSILLVAILSLYRKFFSNTKHFYLLAALLFIFDKTHLSSISWLANRNDLLSSLFLTATLLCYIQYFKLKNKIIFALAQTFILAGLLSSEGIVAVIPIVFFYSCVYLKNSIKTSIKVVIPSLVIFFSFRLITAFFGYKVAHTGFFMDPTQNLVGYIQAFIIRYPILLAQSFTAIDFHYFDFSPLGNNYIWIGSLFLSLFFIILFYRVNSKNRLGKFLLLASMVSAVPFVSSFDLSPRNLMIPSIFTAALISTTFSSLWLKSKRSFIESGLLITIGLAILVRLLISPVDLISEGKKVQIPTWFTYSQKLYQLKNKVPVIVTTPFGYVFDSEFIATNKSKNTYRILSSSLFDIELTVTGLQTIELSSEQGFFNLPQDVHKQNGLSNLFYSTAAFNIGSSDFPINFKNGQTVANDDFKVVVKEVNSAQVPTILQFTFTKALSDNKYSWLTYNWNTQTFDQVILPEINQSILIMGVLK